MSEKDFTNAESAFLHFISQGDEAERCYATQAAAHAELKSALPYLIENLYHEDPDVCVDAAAGLGQLNMPEAFSALAHVLSEHPDGEVKFAAAQAIKKIDGEKSTELLAQYLSCAEAQDYDNDWNDFWDIQRLAIETVGEQKYQAALPSLLDLLAEENDDDEPAILTALCHLGEAGTQALLDGCPQASARRLRRTLLALVNDSSPAGERMLVESLTHRDDSVRAAAIEALSKRKALGQLRAVLNGLTDPSPLVQQAALTAIETLLQSTQRQNTKPLNPEWLWEALLQSPPTAHARLLQCLEKYCPKPESLSEAQTQFLWGLIQHAKGESLHSGTTLLRHWHLTESLPILGERLSQYGESSTLHDQADRIHLLNAYGSLCEDTPAHCEHLLLHTQAKSNAERQAAYDALLQVQERHGESVSSPAKTAIRQTLAALWSNPPQPGECVEPPMASEASTEAPADDSLTAVLSDHPSYADVEPLQSGAQSTLEAVERDNIKVALATAEQSDKDPRETLDEMLAQLPEELQSYQDIVVAHHQLADRMQSSRRKIAAMPTDSDEVLVVRCLSRQAATLDVELFLDILQHSQDVALKIEVIQGLERHWQTLLLPEETQGEICQWAYGQLNHEDERLRLMCLRLLAHHPVNEGVEQVACCLLEDDDSNVRLQAVKTLRAFLTSRSASETDSAQILSAWQKALKDPSDGVQLAATQMLTEMGAKRALPTILALGLHNEALTPSVGQCLRRLDAEQATALLLAHLAQVKSKPQRPKALMLLAEVTKP